MFDELTREEKDFIEYLMLHSDAFDAFVYTPWREALQELSFRKNNVIIEEHIKKILPGGLPELMKDRRCMVLCRNVATPNFEARRFLTCADVFSELEPIILEYTDDRYVGANDIKKSLGRLCFYFGRNNHGQPKTKHLNIIDLDRSNGKRISSINTIWEESLVDFHHSLFREVFPYMHNNIQNASTWIRSIGSSAPEYYKAFLSIFLKNAILFDNFLTTTNEAKLTREIILPAIIHIKKSTGFKPILVALDPIHTEGDSFWLSYPPETKIAVDKKMSLLT